MVSKLLDNLSDHGGGPNRNKMGITFNDHHTNIKGLAQNGKYVFKVIEYKGNSLFGNIMSLGIRSGMISGYTYCLMDVNGKILPPIRY